MSQGSTFVGWVAGGTGVLLIYSAYRNRSPVETLTGVLTGSTATANAINPSAGSVGRSTVDSQSGNPAPSYSSRQGSIHNGTREQRIANGDVQPTLMPIPTQPYLVLDTAAVASFMRVQIQYGKPIILDNSYRTSAQQAAGYASDPHRFAPPGHSLHEKGLAVDVNSKLMSLNDPALVSAFAGNGWFRARMDEPWHWSYGVSG